MTVHLLNAAVMPDEGHYEIKRISPVEFAQAIQAAHGELKHYIGYQNTLDVVEELTNLDLGGINVEQTEMQDGDIFYVARLRRRVSPASKRTASRSGGDALKIEDFDFFRGVFNDL